MREVGRGYGREIARAVVRYGFDVLHMPVIRASMDYGHVRSTRLVEDLGFAFDRRATRRRARHGLLRGNAPA